MSGGGGSSTTVQKADPWAGQQPYLTYGFQEAMRNYQNGGAQPFENRTYVPFSEQTQAGLGAIEQRATEGSPINDALGSYVTDTLSARPNNEALQGYLDNQLSQSPSLAAGAQYAGVGAGGPQLNETAQNALTQTAGGNMLNANPYLDQTYDKAAGAVTRNFNEAVAPSIASQFSLSGRTGSNAHSETFGRAADRLGDNLSGLATDIYGGNYATERDRQLQAAGTLNQQGLNAYGLGSQDNLNRLGLGAQVYGQQAGLQQGAAALQNNQNQSVSENATKAGLLAPQAANAAYDDANRLIGVGGAVEGQAQNVLSDQINRYNQAQNLPQQNLQNYIAAIQGNYGGASTTQQSGGGGSSLGRAAGGALAGSALGSALGGASAGGGAGIGLFGSAGLGLGPWGAGLGALAGLLL